jgi:DNA-binding transcriptional LysR family regulator
MIRQHLNDIHTFVVVAREHSFTRAAARLGLSPSAVSHAVSGLEERLGIRLLTRTTRSVAPTEAGARFLSALGPKMDEIETELSLLQDMRDRPAGTVRITSTDHAADTILLPKLSKLLPSYPDLNVEIVVDYGLTDIVSDRFDAGVRIGNSVAKDMIAVRIGPDIRMAVVASPSYFERNSVPKAPKDLIRHNCVNLRLPTHGSTFAWPFERRGSRFSMRVEGQITCNMLSQLVNAALAGLGVIYIAEDIVEPHIQSGRLIRVLRDWMPIFSGFHLYYASRKQSSRAFMLIVDALRYSGNAKI